MADFKFNSLSPFALLLTPVSLSLFHIHAMAMEDASSAAHGFQMPHVFVVPPEEDETPTWCCFDAALPIDKQIQQRDDFDPNDESFDSSIAYDEEIAAVDAAMARRNMGTRSIVDTLMSKDFNIEHAALDSDSDLEWDSENEYQPQDRHHDSQPPSPSADSFSEAGNDSLVVEVMKVGRRKRYTFEGDDQQMGPRRPSTMKQSGTFTARASQAFRSFTGTLSFRSSKNRTQDNVPPRSSSSMSWTKRQEEHVTENEQPSLPKKGGKVTRRLSQLFSAPSKSQPSLALMGAATEQHASSPLTSPSQPILASRKSSSSFTPASESYDFGPPSPRRSTEPSPNDTQPRATSPVASSSSVNGTFKRITKLKLRRMFSISSRPKHDSNRQADAEPASTASVSGRTTPTLQRKPSPSTSTSSESSGPQTPTTSTEEEPPRSRHRRQNTLTFDEEGQNPQLDFGDFETGEGIVAPSDSGHSISSANHSAMSTKSRISNSSSASTTTCKVATSPPPLEEELEEAGDADVSFEMKLDSLHFDDISFDVDRFVSD